MNPDREKAFLELTRRNPFWVCFVVFAMLAVDNGFRLARQVEQRSQLDQAKIVQQQNIGRMSQSLSQQPEVEARLQALSLDLIQTARTNATARQIVQDFNIQWTPGSDAIPTPAIPTPGLTAPAATAPVTPALVTNAAASK